MKTSQYILISFFGFLIVAVLVLYVDSLKEFKANQTVVSKYKDIPLTGLEDFSSIVVGANWNVKIIQDSKNSISINFYINDISPKLPVYKISNDTLFILGNDVNSPTQILIRSKSLHSIIGKSKSIISVDLFDTNSLYIDLDESNLQGKLNELEMNNLELDIKNSSRLSLNLNKSKIDSGLLKGNNSHIELIGKNTFGLLNVLLENNSNLSLSGIKDKLIINSDQSSRYNIQNLQ